MSNVDVDAVEIIEICRYYPRKNHMQYSLK